MIELLITLTCFAVVIIPAVIAFNWRLKNYLFGWDYVSYQFGSSSYQSRVRKIPNGDVYYKHANIKTIINPNTKLIWLTCLPEKYMVDVK